MFVSSVMTRECVCVSAGEPVARAYSIIRERGFEGLPVLDGDRVVGVVTLWDIVSRVAATDRVEECFAETRVAEVMAKPPVTVGPDDIIEEAALLMLRHDASILPVVDGEGRLVGVLSQSDIFRTLVEALGLERRGTRIALNIQEKVGELARLTAVFSRLGVNIISLVTFEPGRGPADVVARVETDEPKPVVDTLVEAGFRVVHVSQVWA
ncbi:MAG: CBS and ACT domain-containing protein [Firmicutes bacterium]|nr:CBS and ACT domain-containing protein [Bacillota bacterium]